LRQVRDGAEGDVRPLSGLNDPRNNLIAHIRGRAQTVFALPDRRVAWWNGCEF
jgi:hypothetical protein